MNDLELAAARAEARGLNAEIERIDLDIISWARVYGRDTHGVGPFALAEIVRLTAEHDTVLAEYIAATTVIKHAVAEALA